MTEFLLDTNIVSDLIRNPQGQIASHVRKVGEGRVATSIVVAAELRYGAEKKLHSASRVSSRPSSEFFPFCRSRRLLMNSMVAFVSGLRPWAARLVPMIC